MTSALLATLAGLAALLGSPGARPASASTLTGLRGAGFLAVPSGDGGPPGEFTIGLRWLAPSDTYTYVRYQATERLELGLNSKSGGVGGFGVLAVARLLQEGDGRPGLAAGVDWPHVFAVAASSAGSPFTRAHAGVRYLVDPGDGQGGPRARVFWGFNHVLNPVTAREPGRLGVPIATVGLEFDGSYLNAGVTLQVGPMVQVDLNVRDRGPLSFGAGISIRTQL